jgi:hypothetical protein
MLAVMVFTVPMVIDALDSDGSVWPGYLLFFYAVGVYLAAFVVGALVFRIPELQSMLGKIAGRLPYRARVLMTRTGLV